jgi:hypothetical protein
VNTGPLNVREIEALTFMDSAPQPVTVGERDRWARFFKWARATLQKRTRRLSAFMPAADWIFPGV